MYVCMYVCKEALLCSSSKPVSASTVQGYVTFDRNGDRLPFGHVQQYRLTAGESGGEVLGGATLCSPLTLDSGTFIV